MGGPGKGAQEPGTTTTTATTTTTRGRALAPGLISAPFSTTTAPTHTHTQTKKQVRAESASAAGHLNPSIKKDVEKVVDTIKIGEVPGAKGVFCRCWRSAKFPYCDGAHAKHNAATGDNVGPLIIDKAG